MNNDKEKILIIDDEKEIRKLLHIVLSTNGYKVEEAENGNNGITLTAFLKPDLILLDLSLPDIDGLEVLKHIREFSNSPVIILSVREQESNKITALDSGADDYVTKPFSLRELMARARAVLRRTEERAKALTEYKFGQVELDFKKYEAKKKGKKLDLTPLEFLMLKLFIQKKGEVVTRDDFLDKVWGEDNVSVSFRTIDSHIANIRKKIEDHPSNPKHILSIRGVGYKFVD